MSAEQQAWLHKRKPMYALGQDNEPGDGTQRPTEVPPPYPCHLPSFAYSQAHRCAHCYWEKAATHPTCPRRKPTHPHDKQRYVPGTAQAALTGTGCHVPVHVATQPGFLASWNGA